MCPLKQHLAVLSQGTICFATFYKLKYYFDFLSNLIYYFAFSGSERGKYWTQLCNNETRNHP